MQNTLEEIIKVLPKGLITIPKKLRQSVGLRENGLARIKKEKGKLVIEPVTILSYPVRSYTEEEIEEFLETDRKEGLELKKMKLLK